MKSNYQLNQKVSLVIDRETDLGFVAIINNKDEGLLYHNEIFEHLEPGQQLPGYIKKVRENGAIDLLLQPFGNLGTPDLAEAILKALWNNKGFLDVNDKTPAEKIYSLFGVSKKKYKMAIGSLYKRRLITISEEGLRLVQTRNSREDES
jgi:predicted RNA-binding protein (virulence factor B family)